MVEMYASDWVFCLFTNMIPLDLSADFFDLFLKEGWPFFYRFCLSILNIFKEKILEEDEFSGILQHIKFKTPEKKMSSSTMTGSPDKSSPGFN